MPPTRTHVIKWARTEQVRRATASPARQVRHEADQSPSSIHDGERSHFLWNTGELGWERLTHCHSKHHELATVTMHSERHDEGGGELFAVHPSRRHDVAEPRHRSNHLAIWPNQGGAHERHVVNGKCVPHEAERGDGSKLSRPLPVAAERPERSTLCVEEPNQPIIPLAQRNQSAGRLRHPVDFHKIVLGSRDRELRNGGEHSLCRE